MVNPVINPLSLDCLNDDPEILGVVPPKPVENRLNTIENSGESSVQGSELPSITVDEIKEEWKMACMRRHASRTCFPNEVVNVLNKGYIDCSPFPKKWFCSDVNRFVDSHWADLKWDLTVILSNEYQKEPKQFSTDHLRDHVKACISYHRALYLNEQLRLFLIEYIPQLFTVLRNPKSNLISTARDNWVKFNDRISIVYEVFLDLNGHLGSMVRPVWPVAIQCVRKLLDSNFKIFEKIADSVIHAINNERNGIAIDSGCVRKVIEMFVMLHAYESIFESRYFEATQRFYEQESQVLFAEYDVPQYLRHVEKRISQETSYFCGYLDLKSKGPTMRIVHKCLVTNHTAHIVNKGCKILFNNFRCFDDDLSLMYRLFKNSEGGFEHLKDAFVAHIKEVGEARMNAFGLEKSLVGDLLKMKAKLDQLVAVCFEKNPMFLEAQKDAFAHFINLKKDKPAELIAKFLDQKLRTAKTISDNDLNNLMDQVIMLFRFISGKDVFEAFYKRDLSKRLLLGRSASVDAERSMVNKLRQECGPGFTSKLECMFKDMDVSRQVCASFKTLHNDNLPPEQQITADFSVFVLTTSSWPVTDDLSKVTIPKQLCNLQLRYAQFYASMSKGRVLTWHHNLSSAILVGKFGKNKRELDVSMYQALVLLMYNDKNEFTVEAIQAATKIEHSELVRTLIALVSAKNCILIREKVENARFSDTEIIRFNDSYYSKGYKVKIAQVQMKETKKEHQQTEYEIELDRQCVIDAGIVRLMKEHHRLTHHQLVYDLMKSLRFTTTMGCIKKRIETLIEREYLKRCEDDNQSYSYVA